MQAPEADSGGAASSRGGSLSGTEGPRIWELLGPRYLELRGTSSAFVDGLVDGLTHCSVVAEECPSLFLSSRKKQETVKWAAGERNEEGGGEWGTEGRGDEGRRWETWERVFIHRIRA